MLLRVAWILILLSVLLPEAAIAAQGEPKYRNTDLKLKPLPLYEEARLAPIKLGSAPKMDAKELAAIRKGEIVVRQIVSEEEGLRYEALGIVNASPAEVMTFMRDYKDRMRRMPHNEGVEVAWEGNLAKVDLVVKVALTTISYRLHLLHFKDSYIEWEYAYGDIKDTSGFYKFYPLAKGKRCLVVYHVYTESGMPLPKFIMSLLTGQSMPRVIEVMREATAERAKKKK